MPLFRCSVCGREFDPTTSRTMPFCSRRCKLIDLGRWLEEGYSLPVEPDEDEAERREAEQKPPEE